MIQALKSTLSEVDDTLVVHSVGTGIGVGGSVGGLGTGVTTDTGFITHENSAEATCLSWRGTAKQWPSYQQNSLPLQGPTWGK